MDQEVSRGTWLGSSLLMLVASIAIAMVIYGLGRSVSLGYIDSLSKILLDTNYNELVELNQSTVPLTKSAIVGLVDRNGKTIKSVTVVKPGSTVEYPTNTVELTPTNILNALSAAGEYSYYNTRFIVDLETSTAEIIVYVGK